ncbi:hypothetical protein ACFCX0_36405 [Streptomyces sp. NPDC056352]|uniref:hypothetical protein n=1 Tax=Streptomyces sp. NPDC056352 TaxID=3345791 RepID=UPI0035E0BA77
MTEIQGHVGDWAAVVVSALAAGIAIWQALIAKRQAGLARSQAVSATASAEAAQRQADAAEAQVVAAEAQVQIMRRQLDAEEAARIESRRPHFTPEISRVRDAGGNQPYAELTLTQTEGHALAQVTAHITGDYVQGLRQGGVTNEFDLYHVGREFTIDGMSKGSSPEKLYVHFEYRHSYPMKINIELQCTAREGSHEWTEHYTATVTGNTQASIASPHLFRRR